MRKTRKHHGKDGAEGIGGSVDEVAAKVNQGMEDNGAKVLEIEHGGVANLGAEILEDQGSWEREKQVKRERRVEPKRGGKALLPSTTL